MHLDDREAEFLAAARELVRRQNELLPALERHLGTTAYEHWIVRHGDRRDRLWNAPPWSYRFHGLELDILHERDGRLVRVDFGPAGTRGVFSPWGVAQFVCTSRPPWLEFPTLRRECDCDGDFPRSSIYDDLGEALLRKGAFAYAADTRATAARHPDDVRLGANLVIRCQDSSVTVA